MSNWIAINLPYGPLYSGHANGEVDTFTKRELNLPGTLIELDSGEQFLIGDINECRGVCDDCTEFPQDMVVKKYRRVWKPK